MPAGPGKYDEICTNARIAAKATTAVLIIIDGEKGSGFSVQVSPQLVLALPSMLRRIAEEIERSHGAA